LFLNGKSLGRKAKIAGKDFRLVWDEVVYAPGELKVVAYKNGRQWAKDVVKTTGEAARLSLIPDRNKITNDGRDLAFITLKVQDKDGLMVPRSNPNIQFDIEGPGEIVATDNGDATSFVPFQSHERPAFNGMALVIVKAKKGMKGTLVVRAKSQQLTTATTSITVE
jgi:beta-galactosidase